MIPSALILRFLSVLFAHGSSSVAHIPQKKHFEDHGAGNQTRYELMQRSADEKWDLYQPKAGVYGSGKVHSHFGEMHGYEKNMTTVNLIT